MVGSGCRQRAVGTDRVFAGDDRRLRLPLPGAGARAAGISILAGMLMLPCMSAAHAQYIAQWNTGTGNWSVAGNWTWVGLGSGFPNGTTEQAIIGAMTSNANVTLNGASLGIDTFSLLRAR